MVSSEVSLPLERATVVYDSEVTTPEQVRVVCRFVPERLAVCLADPRRTGR